jgi:hypothetical protein
MQRNRWRYVLAIAYWLVIGSIVTWGQNGPCLDKLYPKGRPANDLEYRFDQKFDKDKNGGSFSCGLEVRPSEVRKALDIFRRGVLYQDAASINTVMRFPISVRVIYGLEINAKSESLTLHSADEWFKFQKQHFTNEHLAIAACAYLGNAGMAGGQHPGIEIGDGIFWFQNFVGETRVRLTAVNLLPVTPDWVSKSCIPKPDPN